MQYRYNIAGLRVLCDLPFSIHIRAESKEFIQYAEEAVLDSDLKALFQPVEYMESPEEDGVWEIDRYHVQTGGEWKVYYCPAPGDMFPYACVSWKGNMREHILCRYLRGKENYLDYSRNLCDIIALDSLLNDHNGLLLHASFISWRGQGILFSAPSGTGKSTQADLWKKYEQAEIINGDRVGIRRNPVSKSGENIGSGKEQIWSAYGLPYAGSSGIYRNASAPVTAIIVLRQAGVNRIIRLKENEAFRFLYPELTVHQWDHTFMEKALDSLTSLVLEIPVYLLECLPDKEAVKMVKNTIF